MSSYNNNLREFDNFVIDLEKSVLLHEDEPIQLPFKAVELLCVLVENAGTVVTKEDLLDAVWKDSFVEESVLSQNVYLLRKTFKKYGSEKDFIQTVPRRGYRFFGEVSEVVEEETLTIEKEVIERQIIAEANVLEDFEEKEILPLNAKPNLFTKNKTSILTGVGLLLLMIFGVGFWSYKNSDDEITKRIAQRNSQPLSFNFLTESGNAIYPAISHDGKNISYVIEKDEKFSIVLQNIETKSVTTVVKPVEYSVGSISFSIDGNYLYYGARPKDEVESVICEIPILGGTSRKIVRNIRQQFSLSTDGTRFAFYRYDPKTDETHLISVNTDGSDEKIIATRTDPKFFNVWGTYPAWSPDDKKLIASARTDPSKLKKGEKKYYYVVIDVGTGKEEVLSTPNFERISEAVWLKNGRGIIALAQEKKTEPSQFWHLDYPSGKATRITNDTNDYEYFRLSPDSKSIIVKKSEDYANLYVFDKNNPNQIEQLTNGTKDLIGTYGVAWTNDGKHLIYTKPEPKLVSNLWKMSLETREVKQITFDKDASISRLEMIPNSNKLIFNSNRLGEWNVWQIDTDGEGLKRITTEEGGASTAEITADGKWLFYGFPGSSANQMRKMPIEGGKSIRVGTNLTLDGKPMEIGNNIGGQKRLSPTDNETIIAYAYDPNEKKNIPWKWLLFSHEKGGDFVDLGVQTNNHALEWSSDGKGIYFPKNSTSNIYYLSLEDKTEKQITHFKDKRIESLAVSPDGNKIAFSRLSSTRNILQISGFSK